MTYVRAFVKGDGEQACAQLTEAARAPSSSMAGSVGAKGCPAAFERTARDRRPDGRRRGPQDQGPQGPDQGRRPPRRAARGLPRTPSPSSSTRARRGRSPGCQELALGQLPELAVRPTSASSRCDSSRVRGRQSGSSRSPYQVAASASSCWTLISSPSPPASSSDRRSRIVRQVNSMSSHQWRAGTATSNSPSSATWPSRTCSVTSPLVKTASRSPSAATMPSPSHAQLPHHELPVRRRPASRHGVPRTDAPCGPARRGARRRGAARARRAGDRRRRQAARRSRRKPA